jgi:hypothetical protein
VKQIKQNVMKFETKLNKILSIEDINLKKLKLTNFALSLMPQSKQQLIIREHLKQMTIL